MNFPQSCSFHHLATLLAKKTQLTLFLSLLFVANLFAQPVIDLCLTPTTEGPYLAGQLVTVETLVEEFENIGAFQFGVEYQSTAMEFNGAENEAIPFTFVNNPNPENIRISWSDTQGGSVDLPDGSSLISLVFTILENTDELQIQLSNVPFSVQFITGNSSIVAVNECGNFFTGPPPSPVQVCFLVTNMEVLEGEQHGPALEAVDVANITDFNFHFTYNAAENDFVGITPPPALAAATATEISPGLVEVAWSGEPTTIDGSEPFMEVIFEATINLADRNFELITTEGYSGITYATGQNGLFSFCGALANQQAVDFCLDFEPGVYVPGQVTTIGFDVLNFIGITTFSTVVVYDSEQLDFIEGVNYGFLTEDAVFTEETPGRIRIQYGASTVPPTTVPSGTALLGLTFEAQVPTMFLNIELSNAPSDYWALSLAGPLPINTCWGPVVISASSNVRCSMQLGQSGDCDEVSELPGLGGWRVTFTNVFNNLAYSGITGSNGDAYVSVPAGEYIQTWTPPGNYFGWNYCNDIAVEIIQQTGFIEFNQTAAATEDCPFIQTSIASGNLRPCFENNTFTIHYSNYGTVAAEDANLDVMIDPAFTIISSSEDYLDLGNGLYRFEFESIEIATSGVILITGSVGCDFPIGAAICAESNMVYDNQNCIDPNPNFEGAQLQVTPQCDGDSIRFQIENIGDGPSGEIEFHVIEDVIIYNNGTINIDAGEMMEMAFLAEGKTLRLEMDRPEAAPYLSHPLGIEEGCGMLVGGGISTGFVTAYSLLDDDPWFDRYCQETSAAYDPNDKQAIPAGVGQDNDIFPNQTMDYKIRFQNTGTDTAFNVTLRDQIDTSVLDLSTFTAGASSHPYRVMILNNELVFAFEDILLPDSTTNPIASNGYVHFQIAQQADLPDGTVIENDAAIYFDFNEPIFTNVSRQTIDRNLLISTTLDFTANAKSIPVFPTPTRRQLTLDLSDQRFSTQFIITDMLGRNVLQVTLAARATEQVDLSEIVAGHYAYQLIQSGRLVQSGRIVKQ